ncbi:hypothetical protein KIPB_002151 [Kipferlia bialata]|uniref:Uncharacterized protein n=2 Tax=Kipferlia bialata TaxID=797122 RepID=A0A9K3GFZ8_9EUKA|nr:hypothetical protein KIPB_002151 [Kipferlia bialata]|eukprot:g2151.t1
MRHWVCIYLVLLGLFAASASTFSCPNADVSFGLEPDTYICPTHATGGYEYQWLQPKSGQEADQARQAKKLTKHTKGVPRELGLPTNYHQALAHTTSRTAERTLSQMNMDMREVSRPSRLPGQVYASSSLRDPSVSSERTNSSPQVVTRADSAHSVRSDWQDSPRSIGDW